MRRVIDDPESSRSDRRAALRALPELEDAERVATQAWDRLGGPHVSRLEAQIADAESGLREAAVAATRARLDRLETLPRTAGRDLGRLGR